MIHHSDKPSPATAASAIGGKTARACDSCMMRRARWYCAADDAFLCQPCDSTVHSANPLARRHERLLLKSSSSAIAAFTAPMWYHGFKRKARTPRPHHKPVVPELESPIDEEVGNDEAEEEEQLLYRVPVFDPALAFVDPIPLPSTVIPPQAVTSGLDVEFVPTELELAEFEANMESLLGRGLDDSETFCMEELGLIDGGESGGRRDVHVKEEIGGNLKVDGLSFELEVDMSRETLDLDFGCGSPEMTTGAEEHKEEEFARGMGLRLNYESVIDAWLTKGRSPWISDERPRVGADEYWLEFMGMWGGERGEITRGGIQTNVGREARVTRYREKRRTRLFSKKIRYEVRKLNAEKRPRMKGRFVKRASFTATPSASGRGSGGGAGGGSVAVAC